MKAKGTCLALSPKILQNGKLRKYEHALKTKQDTRNQVWLKTYTLSRHALPAARLQKVLARDKVYLQTSFMPFGQFTIITKEKTYRKQS